MEPPSLTGGRVHAFYGGFPQSTVNFCETDYAVMNHVAEFFNTMSSIPIVALGIIGIVLGVRRGYPLRMHVLSTLLALIGLGSVFFHSTLTRLGQATDELSMVLFISALLYTVYVSPSSSSRLFAGALVVYNVGLVSAYFISPKSFKIFSWSFIAMSFAVMVRSRALLNDLRTPNSADPLFDPHQVEISRKLVIVGSLLAIVAFFFFWIPDNLFCESGRIIQFHAIFHVLVGLSAYLAIVFLTFSHYVMTVREKVRVRIANARGGACLGPSEHGVEGGEEGAEAEMGGNGMHTQRLATLEMETDPSTPSNRNLTKRTAGGVARTAAGNEGDVISVSIPSIRGINLYDPLPHVAVRVMQVEVTGKEEQPVFFNKSA